MPLGIERLNVRKSQPNANIVFIKPLAGPNEKTSQAFLEAIAAQCLPVMREHHLYVMSLEEYEPNREFVGRNFNAGEVIQLVLKSPSTGRWLPFEYVQMVMMHELAHCKQMNHSRAFWAVRNQYATQMYGLWAKGYTGDGIWGKGAKLDTGEWVKDTVRGDEVLPEHLCGGTFRSRGRKRKAKPTLSYQERKEKRILKKFGKNGMALGADDETKVKLEKGKRVAGKPRVAGSARGRELRAAAALARFEKKEEDKSDVKAEEEGAESGSDSDYEDANAPDLDSKDAVDVDGSRLLDKKGRGMVRVCEDEDSNDPRARNELDELQDMFQGKKRRRVKEESPELAVLDAPTRVSNDGKRPQIQRPQESDPLERQVKQELGEELTTSKQPRTTSIESTSTATRKQPAPTKANVKEEGGKETCLVCSYANPGATATCAMCSNVLRPDAARGAWQCGSSSCKDGLYWNSGDCGVCGVCGQRKSV